MNQPTHKYKTKRDIAYKFLSELEDDLGEITPTLEGRSTGGLPYKVLMVTSDERALLRKVLQEYLLTAWLDSEKGVR